MLVRYNAGGAGRPGWAAPASYIVSKGDGYMNLALCPYCDMPGLVTTVKAHDHGMDMSGQCTVCGYRVDSDYVGYETADDLAGEFSRSLEMTPAD
jgi:hypothetical protein